MTITPAMAQEWAGLNTRNRPVRYTKVAQFARDMTAGKWMLNGETIKIASDGTILDGQHRLYACIQAEVPFETVVIRGLPMEAQDTIDTGAPARWPTSSRCAARSAPISSPLSPAGRSSGCTGSG